MTVPRRSDGACWRDGHAAGAPYLRRFRPWGQRLARVVWNTLITGAAVVVAADHGGAIALAGVTRRQFVRRVNRDQRALDRRLFG